MDSDLKDRVSSRLKVTSPERRAFSVVSHEKPSRKRLNGGSPLASVQLIQETSRVAGRFQRSALGYLTHTDWHDRMRSDGQHLIDLLSDMGFEPSRHS